MATTLLDTLVGVSRVDRYRPSGRDDGEMSYPVWVSTADVMPDSLPSSEEPEWQLVGSVDVQTQTDIGTAIKRSLGFRAGKHVGVRGYLTAYAEHPWVQGVVQANPSLPTGLGHARKSPERFWLAIDVTAGAIEPRFLVGVQRAKFADNSKRPPEPHPGASQSTCALPIQILGRGGLVFQTRTPGTFEEDQT